MTGEHGFRSRRITASVAAFAIGLAGVLLSAPLAASAEDTSTNVLDQSSEGPGLDRTYGTTAGAPDNVFFVYVEAGDWLHVFGDYTSGSTESTLLVTAPDGTSTELKLQTEARRAYQATPEQAGVWTVQFDANTAVARSDRWALNVYAEEPVPPAGKTWVDYDPHVDGHAMRAANPEQPATRRPGRVWSENYMIRHDSGSYWNDLRFYLINDAGYLYQLTLGEFNGLNSSIIATSIGVPEGGPGSASCTPSYRSWLQPAQQIDPPEAPCADPFRIFFEPPGADLPAAAPIWDPALNDGAGGQRSQPIRPAPFDPETAAVRDWAFAPDDATGTEGIFSYDLGSAFGLHQLRLDLDGDGEFDGPKDRSVALLADGVNPVRYEFDGLDGEGEAVDRCTPIGAQVYFDKVGEIHVVQADVEKRGSIELIRLNDPDGSATADGTIFWDDTLLPQDKSNITPVLDGTAGVDSTGGVHGWGAGKDWATGGWGDSRWIDDWTYLPVAKVAGDWAQSRATTCVPTLELDKRALQATSAYDEVIDYEIAVTNRSETAIDALQLSDPNTDQAPVFDPAHEDNDGVVVVAGELVSIEAGGTAVFTASHTVTFEEAQAGRVLNTASASAELVGYDYRNPETPSNEVEVPVTTPSGSLTVTKTTTATGAELGDVIEYTIEVTNTSSNGLPVTELVLADDNADALEFDAEATAPVGADVTLVDGKATIPAGQTAVFRATHEVTPMDLVATKVLNTATASGLLNGSTISVGPVSSDEVEVPVDHTAVLNIVKTADRTTAALGDTIVYTFAVTNNSAPGVMIEDVVVLDPKTTSPVVDLEHDGNSVEGLTIGEDGELLAIAPGATAVFTASHVVTIDDVEDGEVRNIATAEGASAVDGSPVTKESAEVLVTIQTPVPAVTIVKSTTALSGLLDETIEYDFAVTNSATSPVAVSDVVVADPKTTAPVYDASHPGNTGVTYADGVVTIAPGGTAHFAATHLVTPGDVSAGKLVNQASVSGTVAGTTKPFGPVDSNEVDLPIHPGPRGTVTIQVVELDGGAPVPGAVVTLVPRTDPVDHSLSKITPADGTLVWNAVPVGQYDVITSPPDGYLIPGNGSVTAVRDDDAEETIELDAYRPPTSTIPTTLTFDGDPEERDSGIPSFSPFEPVGFTVESCAGGEPATFTVTRPGAATVLTSGMLEEITPGAYLASIDGLGLAGTFVIHVSLSCTSDAIEALIFIDPAGAIVDDYCTPVSGATARIDRSPTAGGPWTELLTGDANLDPLTPIAPQTTDADGQFAWNTTTGFYRVRGELGGFTGEIADIEVTVAGGAVVGLVIPLLGLDTGTAGLEAPDSGPTITGNPTVGGTLSVAASWAAVAGEPAPITIQGYQWTRDGTPIAGATGASYSPVAADLGHRLGVTVTAGRGTVGTVTPASCATGAFLATEVLAARPLPVTGVDPSGPALAALALLGLGGLALAAARVRRDAR